MQPAREPILNIPGVLTLVLALLVAVHVGRLLLSQDMDVEILVRFAFIPARYADGLGEGWPGGAGAAIWSFATYAALHGDVTHLGVNSVWLLAFGSPVAWRFGGPRFLLFLLVTAVGGSALHLVTHWGEALPMIGASAAVSGLTAAALRFIFVLGGPLGAFRLRGPDAFRMPAMTLPAMFSHPQSLGFMLVWLAINLVYGAGASVIDPSGASIAWEAHIGGFVMGLLAFPLFDPPARPLLPPLVADDDF